jgi:hypothetical protein
MLGFIACNKTTKMTIPQNKVLNAKDFQIYGSKHNQELSNVYNGLLNRQKSNLTNINTFGVDNVLNASQALDISQNIILNDLNNTPNISTLEKELGYYYVNNTFAGIPIMANTHLFTESIANNLTTSQITLLDELYSVIDNVNIDNDLVVTGNKITAIENKVPNLNLTEVQQSIIYIATNVARSSITYWNSEGPNWVKLNSPSVGTTIATLNAQVSTFGFWGSVWGGIKQAAKGDVAGAVGGAVGAAAANIIVGPGTVAYGAAIVSASAAGSAYEAVMYILK